MADKVARLFIVAFYWPIKFGEMTAYMTDTTYNPEVEERLRKEQDRRVVEEGTAMWRRRKEELQRQKHREQREVCT